MAYNLNIFGIGRTKPPAVPADPNEKLVGEVYEAYPYGAAPFGVRSMIQMMIFVVLELKKRGLI